MLRTMIAYCGTDCTVCPAYVAKRTGDYELQKQTAKEWDDPEYPVTPQEIRCDGCKVQAGEKYKFCREICWVRVCAVQRNVETCVDCCDFPCKELERFSQAVGGDVIAQLRAVKQSRS